MNYRHAYHAGNFADVVKHAVLARLVEYLKQKDKAFRVIDTHAGVGLYDLSSEEAQKTGEWRNGIARLLDVRLAPEAATLLAPYLDAVKAANPDGELLRYPGSPLIVRGLLRKQDRLSAIELHPQDSAALKSLFTDDHQVRVLELDGWLALGAHLPPKEKRGLVLVDPPFEKQGEFERLTEGLERAHRRWPGGIYALWYPVKDRGAVKSFREALAGSGIPKIMDIGFDIRPASGEPRLDGTGMIVVNPPFTLERELAAVLPALHGVLAEGKKAEWRVEWLSGENAPRDLA
jgi:23S rRNA (adenine2030-N6)-methyltransferase